MKAVGLVELNSIASGYQTTDAMLKAADVELLVARTICAGKYMVIIGGDTAAVRFSVGAGLAVWEGAVIDSMVISNVHPSIFPAIAGSVTVEPTGALGILEAFSVSSLIEGADSAVKAADVQLIEIRLAMALGGKAFVTMTGDVSAVQAAIDAGSKTIGEKGLLVNRAVIASPNPQLYREIL
ncbi:MAG: BMC domain-containing protein [Acidobacteriota bacterium]|nr:MAG: BMC domain-containing protein [Acidobacteriota bacterium]